ncbi:DUF1410 domain-containing protein [Pasteurellaceae bacterium LIM206]|nr:DUF1410 domain-containing protein [Pasteurellaceae bacterium LIM206]
MTDPSNTGATIDKQTGVITIPQDSVKDNSPVNATGISKKGNMADTTGTAGTDSKNARVDDTDSDNDGKNDGVVTTKSVNEGGNLITDVRLNNNNGNDALTIKREGSADDADFGKSTYTAYDKDGKEIAGGVVDNGDGTLKVLPGVTHFKITAPIVEDNKTEGEEKVKYIIGGVEGNEATINDTSTTPNTDTTADKPTVTPSDKDGSVTITPGADNEKMVITFTGEDDKQNTITLTKQTDGTWILTDPNKTGATFADPAKGIVLIPQNSAKDGSEVTARGTDDKGNEATGTGTAGEDPKAETPTAELTTKDGNQTGGVTITPKASNTGMTVTYTDEAGQKQTITATKGVDGTWTLDKTPNGASIDLKTGVITLTSDAVKDGSDVVAKGQELGKELSGEAKVTTPAYDDFDGDGKPDHDTDSSVVPSDKELDTDDDNDGVNNADEKANNTNPKNEDSDGNGTKDGDEDSDNDGIKDSDESDDTSDKITDKDGDGVADLKDPAELTVDLANNITHENVAKAPITGTSNQLPANTEITITLMDKNGKEVVVTAKTDDKGNYSTTADLSGLADGEIKAVATANDGKVKATDGSANTLDKTVPVEKAEQPTAELATKDGNPTGGVTITPNASNTGVTVTYTDETGKEQTISATKGTDDKWKLDNISNGASVDPATGKITLTPDAVKDASDVTAKGQETGKSPSDDVIVTTPAYDDFDGDGKPDHDTPADKVPAGTDVDTDDDNDGVNNADEEANGSDPKNTDSDGNGTPDGEEDSDGDGIKDGDESDDNSNKITDKDGDGVADLKDPAELTVDLANNITHENVAKAPITGTSNQLPANTEITITLMDKDGKEVVVTAKTDDKGNYSTTADLSGLADGEIKAVATANDGKVKATDGSANTLDKTVPAEKAEQPTAELATKDGNPTGGVTITPNASNTGVTVTYTDETGKEQTISATKGTDDKWTLDDTPDGVSIDPNTGVITLTPDVVQDDSPVKAKGQETGKDSSDEVTVTTPAYDDFDGDGKPDHDTDSSKVPNGKELDTDDDNDGVNNADEEANGSDPKNTDSDGNGTPDGEEDSDGDGIKDSDESDDNSNKITDKDGDGVADLKDPATLTVDLANTVTSYNATNAPITGSSTQLPANTEITITLTDKDGKEVVVTTKTDDKGNYSATADLSGLADGTIIAKADANNGKVTATDSTPNTLDTIADKPIITPSTTDGSVTVTPGADNTSVEITFIDESDNVQTIVTEKGADGTWTLTDLNSTGATINASTGVVTIPQDSVNDGETVTAAGTDVHDNNAIAEEPAGTDSKNAGVDDSDSDKDGINDGIVTTKSVDEGGNLVTDVRLDNNNGNDKLSISRTGSSDNDDFGTSTYTAYDKDGNEITGGVVENTDGTLKVLSGVTRFKITTPVVEDNKTEGEETVKYTIDGIEGNEATINDTSKDTPVNLVITLKNDTVGSHTTGTASDNITNEPTVLVTGTSGKEWEYSTDGGKHWKTGGTGDGSFEMPSNNNVNGEANNLQVRLKDSPTTVSNTINATYDKLTTVGSIVPFIENGEFGLKISNLEPGSYISVTGANSKSGIVEADGTFTIISPLEESAFTNSKADYTIIVTDKAGNTATDTTGMTLTLMPNVYTDGRPAIAENSREGVINNLDNSLNNIILVGKTSGYGDFGGNILGDVNVDTGAGNDTIAVNTVQAAGAGNPTTINMGTGNDTLIVHKYIYSSGLSKISIDMGDGNDFVDIAESGGNSITSLSKTGEITINLGAGDDVIKLAGNVIGPSTIDGGEGWDKLILDGTGFGGSQKLTLEKLTNFEQIMLNTNKELDISSAAAGVHGSGSKTFNGITYKGLFIESETGNATVDLGDDGKNKMTGFTLTADAPAGYTGYTADSGVTLYIQDGITII